MISHPEKVLFPDDGITKGELAAYYELVATLILPHLVGRPLTMERYPAGLGAKGFWQKSVVKGFPDWLERVAVPKKNGTVHYPLINDERALLWMANQNTVTPHVWVSRMPHLNIPDLCVFDLDPPDDVEPEVLRKVALDLRALLHRLGLESGIKTSGSKGFHIVVPLDGSATSREVARFAHRVGASLIANDPDYLTAEFSKADRGGRILIDTGRNEPGATFAAPYAVRARGGAPISAPCRWDEVESGLADPRSFILRTMATRIADVGDVWSELMAQRQRLQPAIDTLGG